MDPREAARRDPLEADRAEGQEAPGLVDAPADAREGASCRAAGCALFA